MLIIICTFVVHLFGTIQLSLLINLSVFGFPLPSAYLRILNHESRTSSSQKVQTLNLKLPLWGILSLKTQQQHHKQVMIALTISWVNDLHRDHWGEFQSSQHWLWQNDLESLRMLMLPIAHDPNSPGGPGLAWVELHLFLRFALEVFVFFCSPVSCANTFTKTRYHFLSFIFNWITAVFLVVNFLCTLPCVLLDSGLIPWNGQWGTGPTGKVFFYRCWSVHDSVLFLPHGGFPVYSLNHVLDGTSYTARPSKFL